MDFDITVTDYPAKHLVGFRVRTTLPDASNDCSLLWQKYHTETKPLPDWKRKKSYGLFVKINQDTRFDFWTASETAPGTPIPKGMEVFELSAGKFVRCLVPTAADLLTAYHAVYRTWLRSQAEYDIDREAVYFEHYPPQWMPNDAFDLYVPLINRKKSLK
jgi:predicted transcriptional regulator YdeE